MGGPQLGGSHRLLFLRGKYHRSGSNSWMKKVFKHKNSKHEKTKSSRTAHVEVHLPLEGGQKLWDVCCALRAVSIGPILFCTAGGAGRRAGWRRLVGCCPGWAWDLQPAAARLPGCEGGWLKEKPRTHAAGLRCKDKVRHSGRRRLLRRPQHRPATQHSTARHQRQQPAPCWPAGVRTQEGRAAGRPCLTT